MKRGIIKLIAAGVTVAVISTVIGVTIHNNNMQKAEVTKGMEVIRNMEAVSVSDIENKIRQMEEDELKSSEEYKNRPINVKYENSLILGDSQAEGLTAYKILDDSEVLAHKGAHVKEAKNEMDKIVNLNPKSIFLTYGVNDLGMYGTKDDFIAVYKEVVEELMSKLPETKIYVNLVFPVQQSAIAKQPYLANYSEYNESIKAMCSELGITCIDSNFLVKDELYEPDGIHMKSDFYKSWVEYMAEVAEL